MKSDDGTASDHAARIMPERLVVGSSGSVPIMDVARDGVGLSRDLTPGETRLGPFILPDFQRPPAWTDYQGSRLIESIYMGLPYGSLTANDTSHGHECDGWLLDGQQRVRAICAWVSGELPVRGRRFPDLPEVERAHFERIKIPILVTSLMTRAACEDIYDRLAYGGTPHVPKAAA